MFKVVLKLFVISAVCFVSYASTAEDYVELPIGKYSGDLKFGDHGAMGQAGKCLQGRITSILVREKNIIFSAFTPGDSRLGPLRFQLNKNTMNKSKLDWHENSFFNFNIEVLSFDKIRVTVSGACKGSAVLMNPYAIEVIKEVNEVIKEVKVTMGEELKSIKIEIAKIQSDILEFKTILTKFSEEEEKLLEDKYKKIEEKELKITKKKKLTELQKEQDNIKKEKIALEKAAIKAERNKLAEEREALKKELDRETEELKQQEEKKLAVQSEELILKKKESSIRRGQEADQIRMKLIWSNETLKYFLDDIELFLSLHKDTIDMLQFIEIVKPVKIIKNKEIFNEKDLKAINRLAIFLLENKKFKNISDEAILKRKSIKIEDIEVARANLESLLEFTYSYLINNSLEDGISGLTRLFNDYKNTDKLNSYKEFQLVITIIKDELSILGIDY